MKSKLYHIFLLLVLSIGIVNAQVVIYGTVTDSLGNPVPNKNVYMRSATIFSWHTTQTNQNGFYLDSIAYNQGDSILVEIFNCDSTGLITKWVGPPAMAWDTLNANFVTCQPNNPPTCNGSFTYQTSGNILFFTALSTPAGQFQYTWNFGDGSNGAGTNPTHTYSNPGDYLVCVTGSNGFCTFTYCDTVTAGSAQPVHGTIFGMVTKNGVMDPNISGYAGLYIPDSTVTGGPWSFIGLTSIDSGGYYYFDSVESGLYYVLADLLPSDIDFGSYFPTYHSTALNWNLAQSIQVGTSSVQADVSLQPTGFPGAGPARIGGSVIDDGLQNPGMAMEDVQIQLLDQSGNELVFEITDNLGEFDFPNLAYGTYQLRVEIPGILHALNTITVSAANPNSTVSFLVNSNSVVLGIGVNELNISLDVYPNPVQDELNVSLKGVTESSNMKVRLLDIHGEAVMESPLQQNNMTFELDGLPSGVYLLEITNGNSRTVKRVIKD